MQRWPGNCNDINIMCVPGVCLNDESCMGLHAFLCERGYLLLSSIFLQIDCILFFINQSKE
jgi:hypothetical protein